MRWRFAKITFDRAFRERPASSFAIRPPPVENVASTLRTTKIMNQSLLVWERFRSGETENVYNLSFIAKRLQLVIYRHVRLLHTHHNLTPWAENRYRKLPLLSLAYFFSLSLASWSVISSPLYSTMKSPSVITFVANRPYPKNSIHKKTNGKNRHFDIFLLLLEYPAITIVEADV